MPGLVAAGRQAQAGLQALAVATAGEDLDHPADGVAAVHRRTRAAQHFHPFDLLDVEKLQAAVAGGGVGDAHAIDQHQRLRGLGATDEDAGQAATAAGRCHLHAGHAGEQVADAGGLQAVDVAAGEHRVGGAGGAARFDLTAGADQYVGELEGVVAGGFGGQGSGGEAEQ